MAVERGAQAAHGRLVDDGVVDEAHELLLAVHARFYVDVADVGLGRALRDEELLLQVGGVDPVEEGRALASMRIFGFPVFCLVCPIGLSFAMIILVWRLFVAGDITWSVILVPALLVFELVFFRQWCGLICPIGAFQNLFGRFARSFRPQIDDKKCIETITGKAFSKCAILLLDDVKPSCLFDGDVHRYRMRSRAVKVNDPHQILNTMKSQIEGDVFER